LSFSQTADDISASEQLKPTHDAFLFQDFLSLSPLLIDLMFNATGWLSIAILFA
jgi:hypothetical protein